MDGFDFPVILILTNGRSGSNLLADMLGNLTGNLPQTDVFNPNYRGDVDRDAAFFKRLQENLGCHLSGVDDPKLGAIIQKDKVSYFRTLCKTAKDVGYTSLSCKIFPEQIAVPELEQILALSSLRVIFLVRRRIDRHISSMKAIATNIFVQKDTTEHLPQFDIADFLDSSMATDRALDAFWQVVQKADRAFTVLSYDRDLDIENTLRHQFVAQALGRIGVTQPFAPYHPPNWLGKQDRNLDWREKIANGFSAAAGLAGLGLLDYAQTAPLMDVLPTKRGHVLSRAKLKLDLADALPRRAISLQEGGYFRAFSQDPMLTMTSIQFGRSFFAEWMAGPDAALDTPAGVHFLKPTWTMQTSPLDALGQVLRLAEDDNPGHIFIALHVNAAEAENYRRSGIRSILGNIGLFENENVWAEDAPALVGIPDADALMIAALVEWKNHHLAAQLGSINLVYANPSEENLARVRAHCPQATFVNHQTGKYTYLQRHDMRAVMSRAKVFLALSKEEGAMRASLEALLSGLPVLSTPSIGGRDAFFAADNALIVDPTPQAVRHGVEALIARNLTRDEVRRATMDIIRPMRRDFEKAANQAIAAHLGPMAPELRVRDVFGLLTEYQNLGDFVKGLQ